MGHGLKAKASALALSSHTCACALVVAPAPATAHELSSCVSVGGDQVGTAPQLAVIHFVGCSGDGGLMAMGTAEPFWV
ncbi:hypothetical protein [Sorangium sp. So ce1078]|uniref:hypothetical protein n=1 Tax=Sorangium sp. So ce1078 TaxID=3133329 RepID=UPI003F631794